MRVIRCSRPSIIFLLLSRGICWNSLGGLLISSFWVSDSPSYLGWWWRGLFVVLREEKNKTGMKNAEVVARNYSTGSDKDTLFFPFSVLFHPLISPFLTSDPSPTSLKKLRPPRASSRGSKLLTSFSSLSLPPPLPSHRPVTHPPTVLVVLQFFPRFTTVSPGLSALPLIVVLAITAIKDGYEDVKRHQSDRAINGIKVCFSLSSLPSPSHLHHNIGTSPPRSLSQSKPLPRQIKILRSPLLHLKLVSQKNSRARSRRSCRRPRRTKKNLLGKTSS